MPSKISLEEVFWINVKARIKQLNIPQKELASQLGISQKTLETQVFRKSMPKLQQAMLMAKVLNTSLSSLCGELIVPYDKDLDHWANLENILKTTPKEKILEVLQNKEQIREDYMILNLLTINDLENEKLIKDIIDTIKKYK